MKWLKNIRAWLLNNFTLKGSYKPIVSKYRSFETRDVIFECVITKKRYEVVEFASYYRNEDFSIETTNFITDEEFTEILNGAPLENYPHLNFYVK